MATTVVAVAESGGSMGGLGYPGLLETRRSASDVHSRLFCFFLLASVVSAAVADDGGAGSGGLGGSGGRKLGQWRPWILRFRWCCEPSDERERPSSIVARDFSVLLGDIGSGGFGGGGARSGGTGGIGGSSAVLRSLPTDSSFPAFFAVVVLVKSVIGVTSFSCSSLFVTSSSSPSSNSAILKNEIGWFDDTNNTSSMLSSRLESDATLLRTIVVDRSTILLQNVGLVVASFIIAFMLNWRITLVVLATYPLIICGHISEKLFMKGYGGNLSKAYLKANMLAGEAVSNIRTVAAFCSEEKVLDLYANELVDPSKNSFRRGQIAGIFYGISQFFIFSSYGLALWYGSVLMYKELASFKSVMKSFMVLIVTALAMGETLALAPDLLKGNQMVASVFEVMDRKTGIIGDVGEELKTVEGTIELKRIHFGYPSRPDVIIFKDFNLLVPSGKSIALVGQSGSGKSSVISLILRFYDPTSGKVMIDGKDVRRLNLKSLRKHIGLVQQEPALFATSIYENILYGKEGASDSEVIEAAKLANAHNFISGLPEGYSTKVGERGVQLSGGQRQRVAIARAVLKNPEILLLDEATSALDVESERVVQQALDRLMQNRTTVIVAHRLSTIRNADQISVLQDGKIIEQGTHSSLIENKNGPYFKLVNLQQQQHQQ